jgi:hypothetical protein
MIRACMLLFASANWLGGDSMAQAVGVVRPVDLLGVAADHDLRDWIGGAAGATRV